MEAYEKIINHWKKLKDVRYWFWSKLPIMENAQNWVKLK